MVFGLQVRSRRSFMKWMAIELQLLKREWKLLLPCAIMQYVHGVIHNLAYWVQGNKLTLEQRVTLRDVGFIVFPKLTGFASHISEFLVFGGCFAPAIILVLSIPVLRQNPAKPRYLVIVLKRVLFHITIALILRMISFLITTLPSPAAHCSLKYDDACLKLHPDDPLECVITNPDFDPPSVGEFFYNMDSTNGCGDLMFSSHTIYTVSLILAMLKYFYNKYFAIVLVVLQAVIAFLIVASHKHYSLDVFTALYVVPMLWFTHEAYYRDINHKDAGVSVKTMQEYYDIDIRDEFEIDETALGNDNMSLQVTLMETGNGEGVNVAGNATVGVTGSESTGSV